MNHKNSPQHFVSTCYAYCALNILRILAVVKESMHTEICGGSLCLKAVPTWFERAK